MAKKNTIGKMRERIDIMTVSDAPFGEYSLKRTLTVAATRWAKVKSYSLAQRAARGLSESLTHHFTIREGVTVDVDNLIRWKGNLYKVLSTQVLGNEANDPRETFLGLDTEFQGSESAYNNPSPETEV